MGFGHLLKSIGSAILKGIGVAAGVATGIAPFLGLLGGPAAAIAARVLAAVQGAEQFIQGAQQGVAKKESVLAILKAELPVLEELVQTVGGGKVQFGEAELSALVDSAVDFHNKLAAFTVTVKKA